MTDLEINASFIASRLTQTAQNRQNEVEEYANEILEILATERYEPSERGAGWAVTDTGYTNLVSFLKSINAYRVVIGG